MTKYKCQCQYDNLQTNQELILHHVLIIFDSQNILKLKFKMYT